MRERYAQLLHSGGENGRLLAAPYTPPEAGDKFPFVITERAIDVSLGGHCTKQSVGDKMEYPYAVTSGEYRIDRIYYMEGALMSLFARFISSDAQFAPENDPDNPDIAQKFDLENGKRS